MRIGNSVPVFALKSSERVATVLCRLFGTGCLVPTIKTKPLSDLMQFFNPTATQLGRASPESWMMIASFEPMTRMNCDMAPKDVTGVSELLSLVWLPLV
jgi:hypothetical protein